MTFSEHAEKVGRFLRYFVPGMHMVERGAISVEDALAALAEMKRLHEERKAEMERAYQHASQFEDRGDFLIYRNEYEALVKRAERAEAALAAAQEALEAVGRFAASHSGNDGQSVLLAALYRIAEESEAVLARSAGRDE